MDYQQVIEKYIGISFSVLIVGALLGLTLKLCWDGYIAHKSNSWPSTKGIILESRYDEFIYEKEDNGFTKTEKRYDVNLSFEYYVGSKMYTSDRLTSGMTTGIIDKSVAVDIINKYETGKEITVYFDPEDPEYGILEIAPLSKDLFWAGFFGFLTLLLGYLFFIKKSN